MTAAKIVNCPKCGRTIELMKGQVAYCNLLNCRKRNGQPRRMRLVPPTKKDENVDDSETA